MDKNAIKKYAVWARRELIARVSQRAALYGIMGQEIADTDGDSINGHVLSDTEKQQRDALLKEIDDKGYEQVMEEAAYTWFNRFSALRFMEVNGYLPSRVRVFTDNDNTFKPQILAEAIDMELDGLDMAKVYAMKNANDEEALFKYLIIVQCNALNKILPGMFQRLSDYTELLFPDNLLREGSVIQQMIELIPEDDWKDAVQIIGWLYQYYNSEKKDDVFAALKKNVKITKENIPAATQLFTPDWIVRYMVENSLGRLWLEGHPDVKDQLLPTEEEQSAYAAGNRDQEDIKWHYYLEEAEQEPEVQAQLAEIRKEYAALTPDQLKVIDPCSGSGHILAYMFDVLLQIYESYGYTTREAVASIVENNLYGLDIDDRAAQLAYFAVMMKARQYDRRFFSRGIQPHVYAIEESNHIDKFAVDYFCNGDMKLTAAMDTIIKELHDAKEYGSILTVTPQDWAALYDRFAEITEDINMSRDTALRELLPLVQVAEALAQKYDVVVTNPPYMGAANMGEKLSEFCKLNYPKSKADLSTIFMERAMQMSEKNGLMAMINIPVWMFLASFDQMRSTFVDTFFIVNMLHFGRGIFGADFGTVAFTICKSKINNYKGTYRKLFQKQGAVDPVEQKENWFFEGLGYFVANQNDFRVIPGTPIAYWIGKNARQAFQKGISIASISDFTGSQHKTADNEKYLRYWWGINCQEIDEKEWIFYIKGGEYRKWYGNLDLVVDWRDSARNFYSTNSTSNMIKEKYWFTEGITYTSLTSSINGFRYLPPIGVFDIKGPSIVRVESLEYCLGFFNSKVAMLYLKLLNPTITLQVKDVKNTPVIIDSSLKPTVNELVNKNIMISKQDWDSFETSWEFERNPLV